MQTRLKKNDTIKCHDPEDLVNAMTSLEQEGIETDFLYELNGVKGYYLIVTKVRRSK